MADGSLWSGGRAHDHMVQQRFRCLCSSWSLASAPDETPLFTSTRPPFSSIVVVIYRVHALHFFPLKAPAISDHMPAHPTQLENMIFTRPHLPHCPAEVAKEKPRPLVCLHLPQLSGSPLRDLFHWPHLHITNLTRQRGETIANR